MPLTGLLTSPCPRYRHQNGGYLAMGKKLTLREKLVREAYFVHQDEDRYEERFINGYWYIKMTHAGSWIVYRYSPETYETFKSQMTERQAKSVGAPWPE